MSAREDSARAARAALDHLEMLALLVFFRALGRASLPRRLSWTTRLGALPHPLSGRVPAPPPSPERLAQRCSRLVPGTRCLPRALALKAFLARRGTPAAVVLGFRREAGLRGHAWVEVDGHALEPLDRASYLVVLREDELRGAGVPAFVEE